MFNSDDYSPGNFGRSIMAGAAPPQPRVPAQLPAPAGSPGMSLLDRAWDGIGSLFGGMENPDLTPEQNEQLRRQAMLNAGMSAMVASNNGGNLGDAATAAMIAGQQSASMSQEQMIARQEQMLAEGRRQELQGMMGGGPQGLMDAFSYALSNGDFESASAIGSILPSVLANQPKPAAPVEYEQGSGTLVNPNTGLEEQYLYNPTNPEDVRFLGQAGKKTPGVVVNTGDKMDDVFMNLAMDNYKADQLAWEQSLQELDGIEMFLEVADDIPTGKMEEFLLEPRQFLFSMGFRGDELERKIAAQEGLISLTNDQTLVKTAQLAGQISNYEIDFLRDSLLQLSNTPEGNKRIAEIYRTVAERARELHEVGIAFRSHKDVDRYDRERSEVMNKRLFSLAEERELRGFAASRFEPGGSQDNPIDIGGPE